MRLLAVLNPSAHDGLAERRWPVVERILGRHGTLTVVRTQRDDGATVRAVRRAVMHGTDRVVAIGGDGTVHLAATALLRAGVEPQPELAVIPFGTGNDVGKSLALPLDDLEAMAHIAGGVSTGRLDVGRVILAGAAGAETSEHFFVDALSVGMDADVLAARGRLRALGGYRAYAAAMAERALRQRSFEVRALVDDQALTARVLNIIVNNVPVYAGEVRLPDARRDDGLLDLYLFDRAVYAGQALGLAARQLDVFGTGLGRAIGDAQALPVAHHGRRIALHVPAPARVQIDGELVGFASALTCDIAAQLVVAVP